MIDFYDNAAKNAKSLIEEYGQSTTLNKKSVSSYDPKAGLMTSETTSYDITAIALPLSDIGDDKRVREMVTGQAVKFLVAALDAGAVPDEDDTITYKSKDWKIISMVNLSPIGTDILYKCYGTI